MPDDGEPNAGGLAAEGAPDIRRLNTLRGLAALLVVLSHYNLWTRSSSGLFGIGQWGVMTFFLLSAFLMTVLYLPTQPTLPVLWNFAVARVARVVPLYVLVVLASFVMCRMGGLATMIASRSYDIPTLSQLLAHLLLLDGHGVLWTIPAEIHFYCLFAALWLLGCFANRGMLLLVAAIPAALLLGLWPERPQFTVFGLVVTLSIVKGLPYFALGILMGVAYRRWRPPACLCSQWWLLGFFLLPLLWEPQTRPYGHLMWMRSIHLVSLSTLFFVFVFLVPAGIPLLENRIGDKLGELSYSLYLLHAPVFAVMEPRSAWGFPGLFLYLACCLAVSQVSFSLVESPLRRSIRHLGMCGTACGPSSVTTGRLV